MLNNFDSEFCGSVPMYHTNLVQDYGYLLVLDKKTLRILQFSENITSLLQYGKEELSRLDLTYFISQDQLNHINSLAATGQNTAYPLKLVFYTRQGLLTLRGILRAQDDLWLLEMDVWSDSNQHPFEDLYMKMKHCMIRLETAQTLEQLAKGVAIELKKLSGFDKVMVYRFDEQWNGTVIAEEKEEDMQAYLGLTFPASDIPKQARELYLINPYRYIPDVNYQPVPVYPRLNPKTGESLNMSLLNIRSVPAVHIEYLKNMEVGASMSVRIIKDDALWGLISLHSKRARRIDYSLCAQLELLSGFISSRLTSILQKESFSVLERLLNTKQQLVDSLYHTNSIEQSLTSGKPSLLDLLQVTGLYVNINENTFTVGQTPVPAEIVELVNWLKKLNLYRTFTDNNLAASLPSASAYVGTGSGVIVLPLQAGNEEVFIIGFRPEQVQLINWGGNPNEAISFEADNKTYHPRNSFRIWQQEVKHTSRPWTEQEQQVAESFRIALNEYLIRQSRAN